MSYNHMFFIGFSVDVDTEDPEEIQAETLREGILNRLNSLSDADLVDACDWSDSYDNEEWS